MDCLCRKCPACIAIDAMYAEQNAAIACGDLFCPYEADRDIEFESEFELQMLDQHTCRACRCVDCAQEREYIAYQRPFDPEF